MQIEEMGREGGLGPTLEDFEAYWRQELQRVGCPDELAPVRESARRQQA